MNAGLDGEVMVVTGASGGIGRATARSLAAAGARLVLQGHRGMDRLHSLTEELSGQALAVKADVRHETEVEALYAAAVERWGQVDGTVINAGVWPAAEEPIHRMSLARWQEVMEVNLTGAFLCARAFFRHLARRRPPQAGMVLVGSTAALFGEEGHAEYAASKAGLVYGLTLSLKNEIVRLSPGGRVNAVCPGWTRTPMASAGLQDPQAVQTVLQTRSLTTIAEPEDVAAAITYLASPTLARHVSGQVLTVAGGMEGRLLHRQPAPQVEQS